MKKILSLCFILLFCVAWTGNSFAATSQEKLNKMHKYVSGELTKIQKAIDKIMAGTEEPPPPPPPPPPTDNIPALKSGHKGYYNLKPREIRLFKIRAEVKSATYPVQVSNTVQSRQPRTVHLVVKEDSLPTVRDFYKTWNRSPNLSGKDGLWHRHNIGSAAEFVEVNKVMPEKWFYIMLYNHSSKSVRNQRLIVHY